MVKLEIFSGDPPCPGCVAIIELAQRVAARYEDELELAIYEGEEGLEKFEEYKRIVKETGFTYKEYVELHKEQHEENLRMEKEYYAEQQKEKSK